jgi:hypothetical protein
MKYIVISVLVLSTTILVANGTLEDFEVSEPEIEDPETKTAPDTTVIDFFAPDYRTIDDTADDIVATRSLNVSGKVRSNNIVSYAKKFVARHHSKENNIATSQRKKINKTLTNVCSLLQKNLAQNNIAEITQRQLDFIFATAIGNLLTQDFSKEIIYKLWDHVYEAILGSFAQYKMNPRLVPDELKDEYQKVQSIIMKKLLRVMKKHKKDSISQDEIENTVHLVLESFMERMKHILTTQAIAADLAHIHDVEPGKPLSSSIKPNPKSKELYDRFTFLRDDPVVVKKTTIPALPPLADQ